jgi:hypothetical protein
MPYQATIDDPEAFARWRTAMEQVLRDRIEAFRRTEQRLWANMPTATSPDAPGSPGGAAVGSQRRVQVSRSWKGGGGPP